MANINLRDYLAAISVKTENADLDKITILDSSDNNKIKTILKQDLVDLDAIASQLESEFVRVGGIVSSSDQLISDLDARYLNTFGDSVVSQSSQIDVTQTTNYGSINQYTDSDNLDYLNSINVISQSSQIDVTQTTNYGSISQYSDIKVKNKLTAEGVISASSQIVLNDADKEDFSTADVAENASFLYYTDARVKNKLTAENVISSSEQITILESQISDLTHYTDNDVKKKLNNDNVLSGSFKDKLTTENVISSSEQITILESQISDLTHYTDSDVKDKLNEEGIISQSSQVNADSITNFDSNVKNKLNAESVISSSAQLGVNDNTITISGSTDGAVLINGVAGAEFTLNQSSNETFTISLANGLVSGSVIREIPIGTISSSAQIYSTFSGSNLVSQSSQINADSITNFDSNVLTYLNSLGVQSGSDTPHYTDSDTLDYINSINVISQSSQIVFNDIDSNPFESSTNQITASGHIVPSQHESYDLGSPTQRWRTLYLSGSTIDLGGTLIKRGNDGRIKFIDRTTELVKSIDIDSITGSLAITGDLDVNGDITASRLELSYGQDNIVIGKRPSAVASSGISNTLAYSNVLIGYNAAAYLTLGDYNVAIGHQALRDISDESADYNIGIGYFALGNFESGSNKIAIGRYASSEAESDSGNSISIGSFAGQYADSNNISIGEQAGRYMSGGGNGNVAIGAYVGKSLTNAGGTQWNTAVGNYSLGGEASVTNSTISSYNAAFGGKALNRIQTGLGNVAVGYGSLALLTDADHNTSVGMSAGNLVKGEKNSLFGFYAGVNNLISGSGNTLLGSFTEVQNSDDYNSIVIGSGSVGKGSNTVVIGNDDITTTYLNGKLNLVEPGYNLVIDSGPENQTGGSLSSIGNNNILLGRIAGDDIVAGDNNVAIGTNALGTISNEASDANVAIGEQAMFLFESGSYNVAIGRYSLRNGEDGSDYNVSLGYYSGYYAKGDYSVSIGAYAGKYATTKGVYIGADVGNGLGTGSINNTGVGGDALGGDGIAAAGSGDYNAAFGFQSLSKIKDGSFNTSIGSKASQLLTDGRINTSVGYYSLQRLSTGDNNTTIGYRSGYTLISGSGNTLLGTNADTQNSDDYNSIVIGSGSVGNGSNTIVIGNDDITHTYLKGDLDVNGSISGSSIQLDFGELGKSNNVSISVGSATSLQNLGYGSSNVMIGVAGRALQSGSNNVGIGSALGGIVGTNRGAPVPYSADMPSDNIGIGRSAANGIVTGSFNIAIGAQALQEAEADANGNVAIGNVALFRAKGDYNTAVGFYAGQNAGFQTTAIGAYVGFGLKEGANYNTGVGYASVAGSATYNQSTGDHNTGTGYRSLQYITSGSYNVGFGGYALSNVRIGIGNVSVGYSSGTGVNSGNYNVLLGYDAEPETSADNNSIVIGKQARGKGSNTVVIGNDDITSTELKGDVTGSNLLIKYNGNPSSALEYGNTSFNGNSGTGAKIKVVAQNLHSGTNLGTRLKFDTCTLNSTTLATRHQINDEGYTKITSTGTHYNESYDGHEIYSEANNSVLSIVNGISGSFVGEGMEVRFSEYAPNNTYNAFFRGRDYDGIKVYIYSNGDLQNANNAYGAISDIKVKENIVDTSPKLDDLMQVQIRNYNLIGDDKKQLGVIAQELETIFPNMISETPDIEEREVVDEDGNVSVQRVDLGTVTKSVKYSVFTPILIKALQEQQEIINDLKSRIETLENQ